MTGPAGKGSISLGGKVVSEIGHEPGVINVYYVDGVDFNGGAGPRPWNGIWVPS